MGQTAKSNAGLLQLCFTALPNAPRKELIGQIHVCDSGFTRANSKNLPSACFNRSWRFVSKTSLYNTG